MCGPLNKGRRSRRGCGGLPTSVCGVSADEIGEGGGSGIASKVEWGDVMGNRAGEVKRERRTILNWGRMYSFSGLVRLSAPLSMKITRRRPESIISPKVGQSSLVMMGWGGMYASLSRPVSCVRQ